jgi:hypothetical protein
MRKILAGSLVLFILAISVPFASAYNCPRHRNRRSVARSYYRTGYQPIAYRTVYRTRYQPVVYRTVYRTRYRTVYRIAPTNYGTAGYVYRRPSFYQRHKHAIDVGVGTGAGALIGGIAHGGRGAGVGALLGAGSGALFSYVLDKRRRRY